MATLNKLTPFVVVSDMADSISFFQDILGFTVRLHVEGYAYLSRDSVAIRLILADSEKDLKSPNSQQHCYIDVTGIDELYDELEPRLQALSKGRVKAPFDTQYGQREFHVIDPDALLISFGERTQI